MNTVRRYPAEVKSRSFEEGSVAGPEDVELATREWVWWFNHHRLLAPIGKARPVEYERRTTVVRRPRKH